MATAADGEVKLYNESRKLLKQQANLIFHGKFGTAANHVVHEFKIPAAGIYCF